MGKSKVVNRLVIMLLLLILAAVAAACAAQEPVEKIVTVTVEVPKPVTVEVTKEVIVEVTKEVPVEVVITPVPAHEVAAQNLVTSLHATTQGMRYFYEEAQGGFETLTGVAYDDLGCKNCHAVTPDGEPNCQACHVTEAVNAPPQFKCTTCHGRQNFEIVAKNPDGTKGMTDVHYSKGMQCVNCHSATAVHGDGNTYNSLLESPAKSECTDCHVTKDDADWSAMPAHNAHEDKLDCAACHVQVVNSCYNCHFDTEVNEKAKVEYRKYFGWRFLVRNDEGKITTANIMTMVYEDTKSFAVLAPYYGHTITRPDPATVCNDCHKNANVAEYNETGQIVLSKWDENAGALNFAQGVIPVPPDYQTSFIVDYVTRDGDAWNETKSNWKFMKTGTDMWQMLFGQPLEAMPMQFP